MLALFLKTNSQQTHSVELMAPVLFLRPGNAVSRTSENKLLSREGAAAAVTATC